MNNYTPKKRKACWADYAVVGITTFLLIIRFRYGSAMPWVWVIAPLFSYLLICGIIAYHEMNKAIERSIEEERELTNEQAKRNNENANK